MPADLRGFTWKITGVSISAAYVKVHPIRIRLCSIAQLSLPHVSNRLRLPADRGDPPPVRDIAILRAIGHGRGFRGWSSGESDARDG
jgi:hypothetical protein